MKTASLIAVTTAALLLAFTFGCGPAAPTNVNVDTSTLSSNTTGAGGNVTAGAETPVSDTP